MEWEMSEADQKAMDEAFSSLVTYERECDASNARITRAVKSLRGEEFWKEVELLFEECEVGQSMWNIEPWVIVRSCPSNENESNTEDWEYIEDYRIQQWSVGDSSDSWEGYVYVWIKEDRWLRAAYKM